MFEIRAPVILVIMAYLLAFTSAGENDKQRMEIYRELSNCCKTTKVLVSVFQQGGLTCGGKYLTSKISTMFKKSADPQEIAPEFKDGCLIECVFKSNSYLNGSSSIMRKEFSDELIKKAEKKGEEVKGIIETALAMCFEIVTHNPIPADSPMCKSNSQLLISCVARYILLNCPESAWKEEKEKCSGKRESFKRSVTSLEKEAIEAAKALQIKTQQ